MTVAKPKETKQPLSKRQRHKAGLNKSNSWQQQPKIKSLEARDKAYIRIAGLGQKAKKASQSSSTKKEPLNPDDDIINSTEYKFGRLLASPLARTRHATILKLKEYLKARTNPNNENGGLSALDLMKLWKGLWHTLYLCDGVAVQEEVSKLLASLIWSVGGTQEEDEYAGRFYLDLDENMEEGEGDDEMQIIEMEMSDDEGDEKEVDNDDDDNDKENTDEDMDDDNEEDEATNPAEDENTKHCRGAHLSALYIRTYFRTLTREWSNMDKYRIDKFYTLTRFILREIYRYMASRHWNLGIIRLFNDAIFEEVLKITLYGNGVKYHLLDICVEELALVNSEDNGLPLTEATFLDCLEPYFALAQRADDKRLHERVMEKVISRFLDEYSIVSDNYANTDSDAKVDEEKKKLVMDQVHVQTVAQFIFEVAGDSETQDRYRKQLYDMHKKYMKRVKLVGRDVNMDEDSGSEPDTIEGEEDDVIESSEVDVVDVEENGDKDDSRPDTKKEDQTQEKEAVPNSDEKKKKNKKKKKKDKKKKKAESEKARSNDDNDEVITISSEEQKVAAKAATKAEKKAKTTKKRVKSTHSDTSEDDGNIPSSAKKVKFGKVNRSKSWKASMKDLKKLDPKATLERTPEKSILLTPKKGGKAKKKSKKAANKR